MSFSGCWVFEGHKDKDGYGLAWWKGRTRRAHRLVFEATYGYLPPVVRHRCDNPPCYNPAHLLPGTHAENVRDMINKGRQRNQRKTRCPRGHAYSHTNTDGQRVCGTCANARRRKANA